jgi:aminocarboxymuconate-semialdehyde decarboxylase
MLGSDYCFRMGLERPVDALMQVPGLDDAERTMILSGTAGRLLRIAA